MIIDEDKNRGMTDQLLQTDRIALLVVKDQIERNLLTQLFAEPNPLLGGLLFVGLLDMGVNATLKTDEQPQQNKGA
jgi:hypothetical protein